MAVDIHSKYFIRKANGGLSPCIPGNDAYGLRPFNGSTLPNCVGLVTGEFNRRIFGEGEDAQCKYLGNRNAKEFGIFAEQQGLKTGQDPAEGACMVWGGSGDGHVAIVDKVIDKDTVQTVESGWSYRTTPIVRELTRKRGSGNWGQSYAFLMFIYAPNTPDPPKPEPPVVTYYIVKRGDNLTKIAKEYNTTVSQLVAWNGIINPNLIFVGQKLIVSKSEPGPQPVVEYYTVQRGDNLSKIAKKFGTTVAQLVRWNHIVNPNIIITGQVLRVK